MASASGIRAGKAYVELGGNDGPLKRVLAGASMAVKAFGATVVAVGTIAFAAITAGIATAIAAINQFAAAGGAMQDMSDRTGVATEALSTLKYAAEQTGASVQDIEAAMRKVAKSGEFAGMTAEEAFRAAAEEVRGIEDPLEKSRRAMELFGKSGTKLIPMIDDMEALENRARELGLEMRSADAAAADKFGDAMGDLWLVIKDVVFEVGASLAPELTGLISILAKAGAGAASFIEQARPIVGAVFDGIVTGVAYVVAAFNNWDKIVNAIPDVLAYGMTAAWSYVQNFWDNLQIFGAWLGDNFVTIVSRAFENVATLAYNFGQVIGKVAAVTAAKMSNPFSKASVDIVSELSRIGEGLKPLTDDLPQFTERSVSGIEKKLKKGLSDMLGPVGEEAEALAAAWRESLFGDQTAKAKTKIGDIPSAIKDARQKVDVSGSFNAATVNRLGAGSVAERTAKAAEKTAENTARILDELEDGDTYDR